MLQSYLNIASNIAEGKGSAWMFRGFFGEDCSLQLSGQLRELLSLLLTCCWITSSTVIIQIKATDKYAEKKVLCY